MFKVKLNDASQALINAVVAGVILALAGIVQKEGFDVFNTDWVAIGKLAFNAAFAAFVGSLGKDFFTTTDGNFAGVIKIK